MSEEQVLMTERRDKVLLITINRPEAKNAINGAVSEGLSAAIEELNTDGDLTAGILTGGGGSFSAGMDLKAFLKGENISGFGDFCRNGAQKPLIAAVEGFALAGGLELALACDLIVAAKNVRMGIPEVKRGLFAAGGGLMRLPARVGYGRAMELALTGEPMMSDEAFDIGLVARLAEEGHAVEEALTLAEKIAENAPLAVAASKALIQATIGNTEEQFWDIQNGHMGVFATNDAQEGPKAFAEKRKPVWTGT
jgi:enoyl-CoA hydratase